MAYDANRHGRDLAEGYFEVCYPKTGARYGVHRRSGLAQTLGPDIVEIDGWKRSNDWLPAWMSDQPRAWVGGRRISWA